MAGVLQTMSQHVFYVGILWTMHLLSLCTGSIIVHEKNTNITAKFTAVAEADFGADLIDTMGYLVLAKPLNACSAIEKPPFYNTSEDFSWIALVARSEKRDGCTFGTKVLNAQNAGYDAVIVYNLPGQEDTIRMHASDDIAGMVIIPSVFVGHSDGVRLSKISWQVQGDLFYIVISNDFPFNLNYYLLPFAIVVGICFVLMLVFMFAKWVRDYRKRRKSRLSKANLKKLPVKKFRKGDNYDVCAICLDEYDEGEKLRILPCSHAYHMKCVDPWLTNNKRTCPVCKRRVLANDHERNSDSDDSDDEGAPTERTPLLMPPPAGDNPRRSTFENSGLPIAVQSNRVDIASSGSTEGPDSPSHSGHVNSGFDTDASDDDDAVATRAPQPTAFANTSNPQPVLNTQQEQGEGFEFHPNYFELKTDKVSPQQSAAEESDVVVRNPDTEREQNQSDIGASAATNVVVQINKEIPDDTEKV